MNHWYQDLSELAMFAAALSERHVWEAADVIRLVEKPWKWTAEYHRWVAAGRPDEMPEDEEEAS